MIENFGLKDTGSAGTKIHLMTADDFATWQAKASDAHQGWITAQNFRAKPGKSIYFAANDGRIDFAIGIFGDHAVWDGAALAASLPKGHWQFTAASDDLDAGLMESLALGWGLGQYQFHSYRSAPPNQVLRRIGCSSHCCSSTYPEFFGLQRAPPRQIVVFSQRL